MNQKAKANSKAKQTMLLVAKLQKNMSVFLQTRIEGFMTDPGFANERRLLSSEAAEAILADMFERVDQKQDWSVGDMLDLSSITFLMAIGLSEDIDHEDDEESVRGAGDLEREHEHI